MYNPLPSRDLSTALVLTATSVVVVWVPSFDTPAVTVPIVLPFLFFVSGYALVAALFPAGRPLLAPARGRVHQTNEARLGTLERVVLSFGCSVAIAVIVAVALDFVGLPIVLPNVVNAVALVTVGSVAVATRERRRITVAGEDEPGLGTRLLQGFVASRSRSERLVNITVLLTIVIVLASITYVNVVPQRGEYFTEFGLLVEGEDGELQAIGYPTQYTLGESRTYYTRIVNQEGRTVQYTLVVNLDSLALNTTGEVQRTVELSQRRQRLADGETASLEHTVTPTYTGDLLRLTFLLYQGDPPAEPTAENAYRELHIWIGVQPQATETPQTTEAPEITQTPEITEIPQATETPQTTETPQVPGLQKGLETPGTNETEAPEATGTPVG